MSAFAPADTREACEIVREARAHGRRLRIEGGGSREGYGRPVEADWTLSTRNLCGIVFYEPAEMVIRARAGTPLREIEAALAQHGQMLPFEPLDHRVLYGGTGEPTVGALAACNLSGPRRGRAGAARDSLLGAVFVNGSGEAISAGGRVMKNVTGLDLTRLQCGAHGTLGLLTETTFRLLPTPETSGSLVFDGLDDERALNAMQSALTSPFEVSAAAHAPGQAGRPAITAIRIENFAASVEYRLDQLARRLADFGPARRLDEAASKAFWRETRDVAMLAEPRDTAIWRVSLDASRAGETMRALRAAIDPTRHLIDHGGGLIWLAVPAEGDAGAGAVRAAIPAGAGHAVLVRAPDMTRSAVDVFQPLTQPLMALSARIKDSIDPARLFNPGRMYRNL